MEVHVSPEAATFVRERGGALYLWTDDVGSAFEHDRVEFEPPEGMEVDLVWSDLFELYVERDFPLPDTVRISFRRWPRRRLRIWWGDALWTWRGRWGGAG